MRIKSFLQDYKKELEQTKVYVDHVSCMVPTFGLSDHKNNGSRGGTEYENQALELVSMSNK